MDENRLDDHKLEVICLFDTRMTKTTKSHASLQNPKQSKAPSHMESICKIVADMTVINKGNDMI